MPLDEATVGLLAKLARSPVPPLHGMTPDEARVVGAGMARFYGAGPDMARVHDQVLGNGEHAFAVRVFVPLGTPRAVVIYFHGGGWVVGTLAEFDTLARILADRTAATVVLVDYRLAPEHRYPAAVDDAVLALAWVDAHLGELARSAAPIVVAGDSAGGNLAAVVAQRAVRDGGPRIAAQVLVYPITDCDLDTASYGDPANQLMLSRDSMVWFWDNYAPMAAQRAAADASPLRAGDLSGLPPAIVVTAEYDVLRDEGEAYADRMAAAGVPVARRRFEGQMHGFFTMINLLPGGASAVDFVVEELEPILAAPRLP